MFPYPKLTIGFMKHMFINITSFMGEISHKTSLICIVVVVCVYCCSCLVYVCVVILCVFVVPRVHCCFFFTLDADCWLEVSIRKVLRPVTSTQVFLGFPVPKSKC